MSAPAWFAHPHLRMLATVFGALALAAATWFALRRVGDTASPSGRDKADHLGATAVLAQRGPFAAGRRRVLGVATCLVPHGALIEWLRRSFDEPPARTIALPCLARCCICWVTNECPRR